MGRCAQLERTVIDQRIHYESVSKVCNPIDLDAPADLERALEANTEVREPLLAPEEHDPLELVVKRMGQIAAAFDRRASQRWKESVCSKPNVRCDGVPSIDLFRLTTDRHGLEALIARGGG